MNFKLKEEVKVTSVDLPTNGKHGLVTEILENEDGLVIVKIQLGGKKL